MKLGLKGKRAVILAASRGLGYASALGLAEEGCDLIICSRSQERADEAAAKIREQTGANVTAVSADVSQKADIEAVVTACIEAYGGLEIAVHNAGGPPAGGFNTTSDAAWNKAFEQNLMSFVWFSRAAVPHMKEAGYGRILTIASSSIKQPIPNLILSNAMRTGILGTAKTMSQELAKDNILVNVVSPGTIATERITELYEANAAKTGKSVDEIAKAGVAAIPMGRLGRPEEFANMVVFLASEAASYITGSVMMVDGGVVRALQ
ncbi:MAG: SDR family oxidoreductase [Chloroflexota bacterium]